MEPDHETAVPVPEKARVLEKLKQGAFNVPDFIYLSADDFEKKRFNELEEFLKKHRESFKVMARSAHPQEEFFKGGTFDSLETYADIGGILYARKRIINFARNVKRLSILRQQHFNHAPRIDPDEMGLIVMPYISGSSVMAKMIGNHWEYGYTRDRSHKIKSEPYITRTPHDRKLGEISENIQAYLGFRCEIEFIVSSDSEIHVVQAKDISKVETLDQRESERSIRLDGIRRIRKRRNYRERPVFVMDTVRLYINMIGICEDIVHEGRDPKDGLKDITILMKDYETEMEAFALRHERFAILGLSIDVPTELFQVANHYLDDTSELQKDLSRILYNTRYQVDFFLAETDTLIAKDKIRVNLCSHDAYGIDTVRNPLWSVFWEMDHHEKVIRRFKQLGFKTGDRIGISIDADDKPTVYRI